MVNRVQENRSGWALVAILHELNKEDKIILRGNGPVVISEAHREYIGASIHSNNTAEASAAYWTCKVSNAMDVFHSTAAKIRPDSKYVIDNVTGRTKPKVHEGLFDKIGSEYDRWCKLVNGAWQHVRGHRGEQWNE